MHGQYKLLAAAAVLSFSAPLVAQAGPVGKGNTDHMSEHMDGMDDMQIEGDFCPLAVRGVEMSLKQNNEAVVLDFSTRDTQQRNDLQRLLREASAMIEYESKVAALRPDQQLSRDGIRIPAVDIDVRLTKKGATLIIRPDEAKDGPAVLVHAQSFKEFWDANTCIHGSVQNT